MSSHAQPLVPARSAVSLAWPAALALAALMGIGRFAFTPVWPLMAHDAALSLEQGGWLASANYAGYLLGALIAAAWPPRRPLAALGASLLAVAALTLAMPLPHSVAGWAALRLAAGWASALGFICVASWRPARAGDPIEPAASAVVYAGVGAGIAATGLACLALMAAGATAAQCWVALGALALALSMAAWPRLRAALPATAASARPSHREPLPRGMAGLALHYGVFGIGYIIPATFLPAMAKDVMPDPAVFGWAWPLFGLAAALSCLMVPKLARRHGEIRIWRGAQAAMALGMAVAALRHDLAAVIVAALLVGGTFMVITQAGMVAARRLAGAAAPRAAALMTAAFAAGQIVGPLLAAWTARLGASLPQTLAAGAALLALSAWGLGKITAARGSAGHNAVDPRGNAP